MQNNPILNQVAIVTGAGIGIGFEVAKQLASQGAKVILNDVDINLAHASALQIRKVGGICEAFSLVGRCACTGCGPRISLR